MNIKAEKNNKHEKNAAFLKSQLSNLLLFFQTVF